MKPGDLQERPSSVPGDTFRVMIPNGDGTSSRFTVRGSRSDVVAAIRAELFSTSMSTAALVRFCDELDDRLIRGGSFTMPSERGTVTVDCSARKTS